MKEAYTYGPLAIPCKKHTTQRISDEEIWGLAEVVENSRYTLMVTVKSVAIFIPDATFQFWVVGLGNIDRQVDAIQAYEIWMYFVRFRLKANMGCAEIN